MTLNYIHVQTIIILLNLTLGYIVWTYNSKSNLNRILTLIILCILLIDVSLLFNLKTGEQRYLKATIVLGSLGLSFFPPLLYTLSLFYPIEKSFRKYYLFSLYSVSLLFSILITFTFPKAYIGEKIVIPSDIQNISLKNLPFAFVSLYFLLSSYSVVLLVLTTKNLARSFREDIISYEKLTVKLLIVIGLPLAYLLSLVSVINYFFYIPFPWIGILLAVFTFFLVLLIFRFHLVDVKRLVNGIIFFPALIAILVFIYIFFILKNQQKIANAFILPVSVTLVIEVFVIYMMVSTFRRLLDIPFLRRSFARVSGLRTVDTETLAYLSYARTLKGLSRRLKTVFRRYNKSEDVHLFLLDNDRSEYRCVEDSGMPVVKKSSDVIKVVKRIDRGITLEELLFFMNKRREIRLFHEAGVDLIIPVNRGDDVIALILLPKKGIFQRWSCEDIASLDYIRVMLPSLIDRCVMYESEREIEKHQYRMEQLMVMGQMSSGLAHEIRNPLSIISTSVETMMREDINEEDKKKMLRYIQEEADRINVLATRMLSIDFQKKPELERIDIVVFFHKLKDFLRFKLKESSISFEIVNERPYFVVSESTILFQILLNLVLNSIEAVGEGGAIQLDYTYDESSVSIIISDNGPGIPPHARDKIFDPLFTTKKQGTGLGLAVTKKLIENLFGSITLLPSKEGARFKCTIPQSPTRDQDNEK